MKRWCEWQKKNVLFSFCRVNEAINDVYLSIGRIFTSGFSGRLASDNRKSRENTCFSDSLQVKREGKFQCNSH